MSSGCRLRSDRPFCCLPNMSIGTRRNAEPCCRMRDLMSDTAILCAVAGDVQPCGVWFRPVRWWQLVRLTELAEIIQRRRGNRNAGRSVVLCRNSARRCWQPSAGAGRHRDGAGLHDTQAGRANSCGTAAPGSHRLAKTRAGRGRACSGGDHLRRRIVLKRVETRTCGSCAERRRSADRFTRGRAVDTARTTCRRRPTQSSSIAMSVTMRPIRRCFRTWC